jgi:hypothetical protein
MNGQLNYTVHSDHIEFPFDRELKRYQTSPYAPFMTDNRVSVDEIDQVLNEFAKIYLTSTNPTRSFVYNLLWILLPLTFVTTFAISLS